MHPEGAADRATGVARSIAHEPRVDRTAIAAAHARSQIGGKAAPRSSDGISRRIATMITLAGLLLVAFVLSLCVGAYGVSIRDAIVAVTAFPGDDRATEGELVAHSLRLPRTLVGLAVGAGLGVAGALMQGVTRNHLADPALLGISGGAALAVAIAIALGRTTVESYVWFALLGASGAAALVYSLGSIGGATPIRLAIAGAIVAAIAASATSAIYTIVGGVAEVYRFWAAGSVAGVSLDTLLAVTPFLVAGLVLSIGLGRGLNGLSLGDDVARALGQRVTATRAVVALAVVLLAGAAVAVAGPIGFVGLIAPHAARFLFGPDYRWILPASALLGAALLVGCDVLGRVSYGSAELPAGVVTPLVGAPFFVYLARRRRLDTL